MGLFDKKRSDPNEEYQAMIKEEAKWRRNHPGQELPLWLHMKRQAVAKRMADHIQGK